MSVWIRRLRVSGGFLEGLDVELSPGLNVVIGARGTGKTTLLRLLRFALGVESAAETKSSTANSEFVRAMLGDGEVTIDIEGVEGSRQITVNSKGDGRVDDFKNVALALGQNEIEEIAKSPSDRRSLLDLRALIDEPLTNDDAPALTQTAYDLRQSALQLNERLFGRAQLLADLDIALSDERRLVAESTESLESKRLIVRSQDETLNEISLEINAIGVAREGLSKLDETISDTLGALDSLDKTNHSQTVRGVIDTVISHGRTTGMVIAANANEAIQKLQKLETKLRTDQRNIMELVHPIRAELNEAATGLGEVTSKIRNIKNQLQEMDKTDSTLETMQVDIGNVLKRREETLNKRERSQDNLYLDRKKVAENISKKTGEYIVLEVSPQADSSQFKTVLETHLQGSRIQYRPLIEKIIGRLNPREFLKIVEDQSISELGKLLDIQPDRAAKILAALDSREALSALSNVQLLDAVNFYLRENGTNKPVSELSTGQKCAVTLPILISETSRALILDQPEDHLDNAFLVENIVRGMVDRTSTGAQTIVATHNPNIPVLGDATNVMYMTSNGERGSVQSRGTVDKEEIKAIITRILEGGADAFQQRATFYNLPGSV